MSSASFICLTNIPTPYRLFQLRLMHRELETRNWAFEAWFMARTEQNRKWNFRESDFDFPHRFLRGVHWRAGNCFWHLNPDVISLLRRSRPDILLIAGSWTLPTVWLATVVGTNRRKIFWSESHLNSIQRSGAITGRLRRYALGQFCEFAVPGILAQQYLEAHAAPEQIYHFPNLVNPALFRDRVRAMRETAPKQNSRRTLLVVARLSPEKGLLQFLGGIRLLRQQERSRLRIVMAGEGPQRRILQEQALDLGVVLSGHKSEEELVALYAEADGFCLSSLSDPNPLSVIEALWAGVPLLLSSRLGNHPECLIPERNGFLFDPLLPESIATAVSRWLSLSSAELAQFGKISLDIAEREFDPGKAIGNFLDQVLRRKSMVAGVTQGQARRKAAS